MRIINVFASFVLAIVLLSSCDDNTDNIGTSLIDNLDHLVVATDTFTVTSRSIAADSVLSRCTTGYIGRVRDPETGAYVTGNFMSQFHINEGFSLVEKDSILSVKDGNVVADSCELSFYYSAFYGDSLAPMKVTVYELDKPMSEADKYYSNFDPETAGYIRKNGVQVSKMYTLANQFDKLTSGSVYKGYITLKLNDEYTARDGRKYSNYGSYIMQTYYEHPEYFKNSYTFVNNVLPGFYVKSQGGLGAMASISISQLDLHYKYKWKGQTSLGADTVYVGTKLVSFSGTEEVLQTTTISNDQSSIQRMVNSDSCTYLKTPAGIFTELTLPVSEIMSGHETDSLNTAKIVLTRINDNVHSDYSLAPPSTLLLIPESEMYSFFEQNKIADYKTSFLASYSSSYNTYTFNNIGGLVRHLYKNGDRTKDNWNKVVVIPVATTYNTSSTTSELVKVTHDMSLSSTRLVGGSGNSHAPIKMTVIYSKFK